jgi:hypothetical protein
MERSPTFTLSSISSQGSSIVFLRLSSAMFHTLPPTCNAPPTYSVSTKWRLTCTPQASVLRYTFIYRTTAIYRCDPNHRRQASASLLVAGAARNSGVSHAYGCWIWRRRSSNAHIHMYKCLHECDCTYLSEFMQSHTS